MPTPVEVLWESVKGKQFDGIKAHVQAHDEADLLNAKHPENGRTLPIHLLQITKNTKAAKPRELLYFLLSHPKMDWKFASKLKQTATSSLLDAVSVDDDFTVIESLKDVSGFIYNDKLAYEVALARQKEYEGIVAAQIKRGKPKSDVDQAQACLDKCTKAVALIRDITILHAIKTDNADLMELLDKSGGKPMDILGDFGDKKLPNFLLGVNQPNPKIKAWRTARFERNYAGRAEEVKALEERLDRYAFFQNEQKKLDAQYEANKIAILERAAVGRAERMQAAINIANGMK